VFAAGERAWRWPIVLGRLAGTLLEGAKRLSHCRTPATQANHSWTRVEWIRLFAIDLAYAAPTTGYTVTIKRITVQPIVRGKRQFCVIAQIKKPARGGGLSQRPVPLVDCPAARLRRAWDRRETTGGQIRSFPGRGRRSTNQRRNSVADDPHATQHDASRPHSASANRTHAPGQ
jgi:hypothetical protein